MMMVFTRPIRIALRGEELADDRPLDLPGANACTRNGEGDDDQRGDEDRPNSVGHVFALGDVELVLVSCARLQGSA